jgi:hypothetical protein
VARAANNGGEHGAGSVVTGETGLAHTGAVVNHEGLNFVIHGELFEGGLKMCLKMKMESSKISLET